MIRSIFLALFLIWAFCTQSQELLVLGIAQDAGHPQANCEKMCCKEAFTNPAKAHMVNSIAISDGESFFIFDASPDFTNQLELSKTQFKDQKFGGIIITHAHIGHYTGLMYLGREAMSSDGLPVFVLPRMKSFLETNGPWNQLVTLKNIQLVELDENQAFELSSTMSITPCLVPHRDEYSETAGYTIQMNSKKVLFIPDIDKWSKWSHSIQEEIKNVDFAFLDATFYDGDELPNRPISEVPHPFVIESIEQLSDLSTEEKQKVFFTHFNHTNPLLNEESRAFLNTEELGFNMAREGLILDLK